MSKMPPLLKCKHPGSILREFQRGCYPKKSENYNEPGRKFDESVFVEILAQTLNHDAFIILTI
ncbi:hypothetical protein T11_9228 [Trichinella zimbabwensis]|uniref:Uncharacterized protein n=1 Tax=Trichinella zimbabwensis TaxID=268475 RepID=A0A0V1HH96_9BILA|nr:hypothetical protein T11_9228 [Trichinella zimbabwensis]